MAYESLLRSHEIDRSIHGTTTFAQDLASPKVHHWQQAMHS